MRALILRCSSRGARWGCAARARGKIALATLCCRQLSHHGPVGVPHTIGPPIQAASRQSICGTRLHGGMYGRRGCSAGVGILSVLLNARLQLAQRGLRGEGVARGSASVHDSMRKERTRTDKLKFPSRALLLAEGQISHDVAERMQRTIWASAKGPAPSPHSRQRGAPSAEPPAGPSCKQRGKGGQRRSV